MYAQPAMVFDIYHFTLSFSWYLKEIQTRDAAEDLLNKQLVGTYLVRHSETSKLPGSYTLSLRYVYNKHAKPNNMLNSNFIYVELES